MCRTSDDCCSRRICLKYQEHFVCELWCGFRAAVHPDAHGNRAVHEKYMLAVVTTKSTSSVSGLRRQRFVVRRLRELTVAAFCFSKFYWLTYKNNLINIVLALNLLWVTNKKLLNFSLFFICFGLLTNKKQSGLRVFSVYWHLHYNSVTGWTGRIKDRSQNNATASTFLCVKKNRRQPFHSMFTITATFNISYVQNVHLCECIVLITRNFQ